MTRLLKEFIRRLVHIRRRDRFDRELDSEIQFHLDMRTDELEAAGMNRRDAQTAARAEFGRVARLMEDARSPWRFRFLETVAADVRCTLRSFKRSPGFVAVAAICLALGIGANATLFSVAMEFLFSEPSAHDPGSLLYIRIGGSSHAPVAAWRFLREQRIFTELLGFREEAQANWRSGDQTSRIFSMRVTPNYFAALGIRPLLGDLGHFGARHTVILNHDFWTSRLSGAPDVVGRLLVLDGQPFTIAAVLPPRHRTLVGFGFSPAVYLPVEADDEIVALYGRAPEGMSRSEIRQRLAAACKELESVLPRPEAPWSRNIAMFGATGMEHVKGIGALPIAVFFAMLAIVVILVLLVACTNVASLLLARASSRHHELAVRVALGAPRSRIVQQLFTETALLVLLGSACAFVLSLWLTRLLNSFHPPLPIPVRLNIEPDWRLFVYMVALALVTAILAGLVPSVKASGTEIHTTLKKDEHQVGKQRWTARNFLVAGQLAVSTVLLFAGMLFLRNLAHTSTFKPGFEVDHTIWSYVRLPPQVEPAKRMVLAKTALERLRSIPQIEAATIAQVVPLNDNVAWGVEVYTDTNQERRHVLFKFNTIGTQYFRTMGIPIVAGREFTEFERIGSPDVLILNENFARYLFGNANPVGHRVWFDRNPPATIVGVAKNSKYFTLGESPSTMAAYRAYAQQADLAVNLHFLLRTAQQNDTLIRVINSTLGVLEPSAAIETKPMRQALGFALFPSQAGAAVVGSMGVLGLMLACIGLYGVLLYSVARRTPEIGLRVALGASSIRVLNLVLRQTMTIAAAGLGIGLAIAVFVSKPLAMFLVPELSPTDPVTFAMVIAVLLAAALAATIVPVVRALRVDPITALRYE